MDELTDRQREIYEFIKGFYQEHGLPPTVREIGDNFGMASSSMFDHLAALQRKGYLKRSSRKSRSLELNEKLFHSGFSKPESHYEIPILGQVAAGLPVLAEENWEGTIQFDRDFGTQGNTFALRVKGESMIEAHIMDDDLVIVQKNAVVRNGDIIVALVEGDATVKRYFKEKNRIRLQPENRDMLPIYVLPGEGQFDVMGKVIAVIRHY